MLIVAEAATKLRGQVEQLEPEIEWSAIRGVGNFIRHNYDGLNEAVIRRILEQEITLLSAACRRLLISLQP